MKLLLLLTCLGLAVLSYPNKAKSFSYRLNLLKEAQACTASLECLDGQNISCTGSVWCETFGTVAVFCDGNQSVWCY